VNYDPKHAQITQNARRFLAFSTLSENSYTEAPDMHTKKSAQKQQQQLRVHIEKLGYGIRLA